MKIKITGQSVVNLNNAFAALEVEGANLPFKVWYAINKTRKSLNDQLNVIDDSRKELLNKYGIKDGEDFATEVVNGAPMFKFKDEKSQENFEKSFLPVLQDDFEVDVHKVKLDSLEGLTASKSRNPFVDVFLDHMVEE